MMAHESGNQGGQEGASPKLQLPIGDALGYCHESLLQRHGAQAQLAQAAAAAEGWTDDGVNATSNDVTIFQTSFDDLMGGTEYGSELSKEPMNVVEGTGQDVWDFPSSL